MILITRALALHGAVITRGWRRYLRRLFAADDAAVTLFFRYYYYYYALYGHAILLRYAIRHDA